MSEVKSGSFFLAYKALYHHLSPNFLPSLISYHCLLVHGVPYHDTTLTLLFYKYVKLFATSGTSSQFSFT